MSFDPDNNLVHRFLWVLFCFVAPFAAMIGAVYLGSYLTGGR